MKSTAELRFLELLKQHGKSKEELKELDEVLELFNKELKYEIKDMSKELKEAGSKFSDPWDMINTRERYPEAIDILVNHISKPYHDRNKEAIFRALTVREARGKANQALLEEYEKTPKEKDNLRWIIANTFYTIIMPEDTNKIISIIKDKSNGKSRHRFTTDLGAIRVPEIEEFLIELLDDAELCVYALEGLGRMKSQKAIKKVGALVGSPNKDIKKQAKLIIAKLTK